MDYNKNEISTQIENPEEINDLVAENGVVGSVLRNPDMLLNYEGIKYKMFYSKELGLIYKAVYNLRNDAGVQKIDDYSIISYMESNIEYKNLLNKYNERDIRSLISKLKLVGTEDTMEYIRRCELVMTSDYKRKTSDLLYRLVDDFIKPDYTGVNQINLMINDKLMEHNNGYLQDSDIESMELKIDAAWKEIEDRRNEDTSVGLPSAFETINEFFTYEQGELVLIGGRKKSGKSMFFLNEVVHKLENDIPTAVFDTEMSTKQWIERYVAHKTGITVRNIKNGIYTKEESIKITEALNWLKSKPFYHVYRPEWTFDMIYTMAKSLQIKIGLQFLIYDYIKCTSASKLKIQEHNYLGDMTNFLKNNVAGKLDIAVLAGGQMSPSEIRMADSDKISRYASVICYWMKKRTEDIKAEEGSYKFVITDNRLGRQFDEDEYIDFKFDGDHALIRETTTGVKRSPISNTAFD